MAFRVSPGVSIKEIDLTTIVPAIATTPGGYAGYFHWGPVDEVVTVTQETELSSIFGKPDNNNYEDFFTASNFLNYGNNLQVVRAVGAAARNASVGKTGAVGNASLVLNNEVGLNAAVTSYATTTVFAAKYPGSLGNSIKVVATSGTGTTGGTGVPGFTLAATASLGDSSIRIQAHATTNQYFSVGDDVLFPDGTTVTIASITRGSTLLGATYGDYYGLTGEAGAAGGLTLGLSTYLTKTQAAGNTFQIKSVYAKMVGTQSTTTPYAADKGGSGDLVNILVLDKDGLWTGTQNAVIEKFEGLSRATDERAFDGSSNYYKTVINDQSKYIWALSADFADNTGGNSTKTNWTAIGTGLATETAVNGSVNSFHMKGAVSASPSDSERWLTGWSKFQDADADDVSLLPVGSASTALARLIVQNICEKRLDCMAFVSPAKTDVENKQPFEALNAIKTFRDSTLNINSSYAVIDSGWKYQLDTYNNLLRLVPLNADIAGLVARTEFTNEAWFSPAGFNRGQIKSVVKLPYNVSQEAHRDELYTRQVNPVVSFPGEGVILFGDKTAQTRPSAFDRINVRRLFIILEKAIATASKFFLFEQNDAFTRAQFKNLVVPFLKTVQQRRGITDFKVVCDETNNTGEVIDRNEFVADIFVKPTRSINFIQLNFVATKTGVNFSEVGG